jgi:hypothetical protein
MRLMLLRSHLIISLVNDTNKQGDILRISIGALVGERDTGHRMCTTVNSTQI